MQMHLYGRHLKMCPSRELAMNQYCVLTEACVCVCVVIGVHIYIDRHMSQDYVMNQLRCIACEIDVTVEQLKITLRPCPSYFFLPFIFHTESINSSGSVYGVGNSHFSSLNHHPFDLSEGRHCKLGRVRLFEVI